MEMFITKIFKNCGYDFEREKTFTWLINKGALRLDFYLPDYNIAIECQGIQHFKPVDYFGGKKGLKSNQKRDRLKYDLCKKHGIEIIYVVPNEFRDEEYFTKLYTLEDVENMIKSMVK